MTKDLFSQLSNMADIPEEMIRRELYSLLEKRGLSLEEMSMEALREVLLEYLKEVNLSICNDSTADSSH